MTVVQIGLVIVVYSLVGYFLVFVRQPYDDRREK
jgi:hypothetical protein